VRILSVVLIWIKKPAGVSARSTNVARRGPSAPVDIYQPCGSMAFYHAKRRVMDVALRSRNQDATSREAVMMQVTRSGPFATFQDFVGPGRGREWLRTGAEQFWCNQDHLLDHLEVLYKGWLERRHEGTRSARQAVAGLSSAENPFDAVREYQQWTSGAFNRAVADAAALQQYMSAIAISMFEPVSSPLAKAAARAEARPFSAAAE
jgi:hypothetical protein